MVEENNPVNYPVPNYEKVVESSEGDMKIWFIIGIIATVIIIILIVGGYFILKNPTTSNRSENNNSLMNNNNESLLNNNSTQSTQNSCTENWSCNSWSSCVNNQQTRNCNDANNCRTTNNKPLIIQNCSSIKNCTENWSCTNWSTCTNNYHVRACFDTNNCGTNLSEPITEENCTQSCSDRELYEMTEGSNEICNGKITVTINGSVTHTCCSVPVVYPVVLPDELRNVWNSISNSGDCGDNSVYVSSLGSCSPYKCNYTNPFTQTNVNKGVIGRYSGKCNSIEELPNNGEQYCQYSDSQLSTMVNYLNFYNSQCGSGTCSIVLNSTGYYLNDILTENIPQDMINSGDCSITFNN